MNMLVEENKGLVRRFMEASLNLVALSGIDQLVSSDFVYYYVSGIWLETMFSEIGRIIALLLTIFIGYVTLLEK